MKSWVAAPIFGLLSFVGVSAGATEAMVHVEAKTWVRLESRANGGALWETACEAPCDRTLDDRAEYRFVDDSGPRASFRFRAREQETITLRHEPRTATAPMLIGVGAAITGVGVAGLVLDIVAANRQAAREADPQWSKEHDPGYASGLGYFIYGALSVVVILAGGSMLVAGIATSAYDDGMTQRRQHADDRRRPPPPKLSAFPLGFTF